MKKLSKEYPHCQDASKKCISQDDYNRCKILMNTEFNRDCPFRKEVKEENETKS